MLSRRALRSERDQLLDEIALMRARNALPALAKATTLLTRFWARGDWRSRGEILRAARVFVSLGKLQSVMASPLPRRKIGLQRKSKLADCEANSAKRAMKRTRSKKPRKPASKRSRA